MAQRNKTKKIGEILIENNLITPDILEEVLADQKKYGGSITQYLISYNFVTEEDVARCVSEQLGTPYLPLQHYTIEESVLKLIPIALVKKYWMVPVDCMKNILTVVMIDPLDREAIREAEEVTGYTIQPFVGLISDIVKAVAKYYDILLDYSKIAYCDYPISFPVKTTYTGPEHRRSIRLPSTIVVHFPDQDRYKMSKTKNVSSHGFLFESDNALPVKSFITMEITLPKEYSLYPLAAVVQVARLTQIEDNRFDVGVSVIKIAKDDLESIISYASNSIKRLKTPNK